jgi:amidase
MVGLRPSPGLVPTWPSDYLWDNLQVTGGIGRRAEDVALMLQAASGPSPLCPIYQPAKGRDFVAAVQAGIPKQLRLAYCPDIAGIGIDENIEQVCRNAAFEMSQAGAVVEEIELDLSFAWEAFLTLRGYWFVAHMHKHLNKVDQFGQNVAGNIRAGLKNTAEDLGKAEQARNKIRQIFDELFEKYDHLLTPCMAVPPFPVEQNYPETIAGKKMQTYVDWIAPTFILSLTGLPVASVPCGLDKNSLPVGLQIVGRQMGEEQVLALAKVLQDAHPIGLPGIVGERVD